MTTAAPVRPGVGARRVGYAVAVLVNAAMLCAVNAWPGWEAVDFLTAETEQVLGIVNASIVVNLVANIVYLSRDPRWLRAMGDAVSTAVGFASMVRIWQVFPFDVSDGWETVFRVLLVVGMAGSAIGILVAIGKLLHERPAGTLRPS